MGWTAKELCLGWSKIFFPSPDHPRLAVWPTQSSVHGYWGPFPRDKVVQAGCSPPTSVKVRSAWSSALLSMHFHGLVLNYAQGKLYHHSLTDSTEQKPTSSQLVEKFTVYYGTQKFITTFTSSHLLSLSWARAIQSMPPHPTSWRSVLILSSHLCRSLLSGLFPSGFPTKTLYTHLLSLILATCPAHLILLSWITLIVLGEAYRSLSSSLCSCLNSPVALSLLGPNILLITLFSNTLSLPFFPCVSNQVSHPYNTKGTIIILLS